MVSEWMEDGNINDFIQIHPNANRIKLVRTSVELYGSLTDAFSLSTSRMVWHICIAFTLFMGI